MPQVDQEISESQRQKLEKQILEYQGKINWLRRQIYPLQREMDNLMNLELKNLERIILHSTTHHELKSVEQLQECGRISRAAKEKYIPKHKSYLKLKSKKDNFIRRLNNLLRLESDKARQLNNLMEEAQSWAAQTQ